MKETLVGAERDDELCVKNVVDSLKKIDELDCGD
jgi:hypothetical protein